MLARYDSSSRADFRQAARAANDRGGMTAARMEMRERATKSFTRYAAKYLATTSDESAVAFGRAAHAFMARMNAGQEANCASVDYVEISRRRPDLEVPFGAFARALEQAIASARTSPQPAPSMSLYAAELSIIERRVATALDLSPALLATEYDRLTRPEDRLKICRASELYMREILAYRSESAGPMIRLMFGGGMNAPARS
jgi:hypothetical protein